MSKTFWLYKIGWIKTTENIITFSDQNGKKIGWSTSTWGLKLENLFLISKKDQGLLKQDQTTSLLKIKGARLI